MRRILQLLLIVTISSIGAQGQINCSPPSPSSQKLVCQIPFSTGVFSNNTSASAAAAALKAVTAFNTAFATQVTQLPLASASAGTVVLYKAGVPETFSNLGPILTDRAQTVGKHELFLGSAATQFVFTDIDGISLGKVPFTYEATATDKTTGAVLSNTYTTEETNIHFTVDLLINVATFGLTNRIDVSAIVPYERVSIGAGTFDSKAYILNDNNVLVFGPYSVPSSYTPGTAHGIGDVVFNGKGQLWHGERAALAAAINVRTPTGDDQNYLGSGAWGFNPYVVYSYLSKVSPHAKIGYQWNTSTELNNPTLTSGGNQALPGGVQYDVGADWAALKRVTLAGDLLGSQYVNSVKLTNTTTPLPTPATNPPTPPSIELPTIATETSTYSISDLSAGLKWNPYSNLILTGNVLFQLNNDGLRSRPTPLVGISVKF
ncbi:MAG: hypothetical protein WCC14_08690 [Acidobacteriaceae bacterium]